MLASRDVTTRTAQWIAGVEDPQRITYVGCDESGAIVGFISAVLLEPADRFDAYLQTLYLIESAARQRLGTRLLRALADDLVNRSKRSLALRVLAQNPARAFYERLGARLVPEGIAQDAGTFDDVVYAFDDLTLL
ncbi:MAG TPA: GNAT family N-acetyltransferase [Candidatus Aquilonibacter sp.]|nr:GNAT family N-acetyltransferase [Candidatus Aquilonibacter sp.]